MSDSKRPRMADDGAHLLGHGDPTHTPSKLQAITELRRQDVAGLPPPDLLRAAAAAFADVNGPPLNLAEHLSRAAAGKQRCT